MTGSSWPQLVLTVSASEAEEIEQALFSAGALSVMYQDEHDQPILEPAPGEFRLWDNIRLVGLFDPSSKGEQIILNCSRSLGRKLPSYTLENLPDRDWQRSWMDDFAPMQFAPMLWVCPSHRDAPDPDAVNIWLDPGLAFGTGTHATTAQCLSWLGRNKVQDLTVLDYGCGSGILAIAAVLCGASHAVAIDIDPQAIAATRENARRNGVQDRVSTGLPSDLPALSAACGAHKNAETLSDSQSHNPFDLLMANILFGPLVELASDFASLSCPHGTLLLSGVLQNQVDELMLRYTQWFQFATPSQLDGWAMLAASRCQD